jgi:hypothetical protein
VTRHDYSSLATNLAVDWDADTAAAANAAVARLLAGQPDAELLGQMLGVGA